MEDEIHCDECFGLPGMAPGGPCPCPVDCHAAFTDRDLDEEIREWGELDGDD